MKKILLTFCSVCIVLSLAGCTTYEYNQSGDVSSSDSSTSTETTYSNDASNSDSGVTSDLSSYADNSSYHTYTGNKFTISAAKDKWNKSSKEGAVCCYSYKGTDAEAATNIAVQISSSYSYTAEEFCDSLVAQYEELEDYIIEKKEKTTICGKSGYDITITNSSNKELLLSQRFFIEDDIVYIFHITYARSQYTRIAPEINKVLDTFKLV